MKILDIRERAVPVRSSLRNAAFDFGEMTTSIVAVITDRATGYAFNSTGRYACGAVMRDRLIPRLLSAAPDSLLDAEGFIDPAKAVARMMIREKPGGDAERSVPIGTIETALWDAVAKARGRPLWRVLADRYGNPTPRTRIPCYVGGGWYKPANDLAELQDEIRRHLDAGYTELKIKTGGLPLDEDCRRLDAALAILGDSQKLAVDANAAMDLPKARAWADRLAAYNLRWFEEPVGVHAYGDFADLAGSYAPALGTGENLFCLADVDNLLRFGGFRVDRDILQIDPPQAYGIDAFAKMVALLESKGGCRSRVYPHGGNMMSFAVTAGLGLGGCEAYPGVFGAFAGYADDMHPRDGLLDLPDAPGIGFEKQAALFALMQELSS